MAYAAGLASKAQPGGVYGLRGPMGAGKTAFVQGFAQGLGYSGPVTSPTFALMQIYEGGRLPLYHFDLYRLEDALRLSGETVLEGLDFWAYLEGGGLCLIEWAEYAESFLPPGIRWITIELAEAATNTYRRIYLT